MDMIQTKENREVKNSVFIDLFCYDRTAEDNVISLYNALHEETLPEGTRVEWMQEEHMNSWCQTEDVIGKNELHFHIQSFIHFITVRKNI